MGRTEDGCAACRHRSKLPRYSGSAATISRSRSKFFPARTRCRSPQRYSQYKANFGKYSTLPASTNSKLLLAYLFFTVINHNSSEAGVAAVPRYFLDLEGVLEKSKCTVREEIVDIRREHPTLPSEAIYTPSCVALNRCSGCCQSETQQCVPTSVYTTRMQIDQEIQAPLSFDTLTLEFTQHYSCECRSLDDTRPVCVQKECEDGEIWDPEGCSCVNALDVICTPKKCYPGEQWNSSSCSCVQVCPEVLRCPLGQKWNLRECRCEEKCPTQTCGVHQIWNPEACRCQCKPCHTRRIFHERFLQNWQTCRCACRSMHRLIEACNRRRAEFNARTCTCERNPANRGRRG